jgi:hypothetical protein
VGDDHCLRALAPRICVWNKRRKGQGAGKKEERQVEKGDGGPWRMEKKGEGSKSRERAK